MKNLTRLIFTLFLAFMAVAILPACSSSEEQPASSDDKEETLDQML